MRIDQMLAGFAEGDAISQTAVAMRSAFLAWGCPSDIYADKKHVGPAMQKECRPLGEYRGGKSEILIHHYSIGSPALDGFLASSSRKILVYHNITPADYFRGFDDAVADQLDRARSQLRNVATDVDAAWAVSEFNATELRAAGFRNVQVFPLLFSSRSLDLDPDPLVNVRFGAKLTTWLFVGRIAPNKKFETLIQSFFWYHRKINPYSRLVMVGSERSCPRYFAMLKMLVGDLDMPNVCFEGFASPSGLPAYYRMSDVFVSASEHEGYCLPLLEAMYMGVPVVARSVGGVPKAMDGAGVLYDDMNPNELAGLVHRVISDRALRKEILSSQSARMATIKDRDIVAELKDLLKSFL